MQPPHDRLRAAAWVLAAYVAVLGALMQPGCSRRAQAPAVKGERHAPAKRAPIPVNAWPRFRGVAGLGVSAASDAPLAWDAKTGKGIRWETEIPLPGKGSPVVWENQLYVTGADETDARVYAIDGDTGAIEWTVSAAGISEGLSVLDEISEDTGLAPSTPVVDAERVYAIFPNGDLLAVNHDGSRAWARNLGVPDNLYRHASSPVLAGRALIIQYDQGRAEDGKSVLIGIDPASGETLWETPRPVGASWSTPIVVEANGGVELVTCAAPWVIGYDPSDGKELWRADCLSGDVAPSPAFDEGLIFVANTGACIAAIWPGGTGDVTESHIVWTDGGNLPDVSSPVAAGGLLYVVAADGFLAAYEGQSGELLWEHDLETTFWSSPTIIGDRIYVADRAGTTFIMQAGREAREVGRGSLGEPIYASPAVVGDRIYMRSATTLYCIEETSPVDSESGES